MQINSIAFICGNCRHYFVRPIGQLVKMSLADIKCPACGSRSKIHLYKVNVMGATMSQQTLPEMEGLTPRNPRGVDVFAASEAGHRGVRP